MTRKTKNLLILHPLALLAVGLTGVGVWIEGALGLMLAFGSFVVVWIILTLEIAMMRE